MGRWVRTRSHRSPQTPGSRSYARLSQTNWRDADEKFHRLHLRLRGKRFAAPTPIGTVEFETLRLALYNVDLNSCPIRLPIQLRRPDLADGPWLPPDSSCSCWPWSSFIRVVALSSARLPWSWSQQSDSLLCSCNSGSART